MALGGGDDSALSWWQSPGRLIPLLICTLFLPFVGKAIHIDDIAFLRIGDQLGWNPLQATATTSFYQGELMKASLPYDITHPLLIPWLLKLLRSVLGADEYLLHLAFLSFPILALWGLSRLWSWSSAGNGARGAVLLVLFAATPAFVVNAHSLMCDVPTLAFLLAGTALWIEGGDGGGARLWLGSLALAAALFCSYQAGLLLPALLPAAWGMRQRLRSLLALFLPYLLLLIWLLLVWQRYGLFPLLASGTEASIAWEINRGLQGIVLLEKALYQLALLGAATLPVVLVGRLWRSRSRTPWLGLVILSLPLVAGVLFLPGAQALGWSGRGALWLLALTGGFSLLVALEKAASEWRGETPRRRVFLCLGLWLALALVANLFILPFGAARYLLPVLPPLFILLLAEVPAAEALPRWLLRGVVVAALVFGLACSYSDYALAGCYRTMAGEVAQEAQSGGMQIWYVGEWGMRHYFDLAGARYLPADSNQPRPGDLVIIPEMPRFWVPSLALQARMEPLATRTFTSAVPLRLFNRRSGAGFYGHYWGMLPFAFSNEPDEVFAVQQVVRAGQEDRE